MKFGLGTGDQPDTDGATYSTFPYGVNYTIFCVSKKQRIVLKSWMNENSIKALLLFRSTKICRQYSIKKQHLIWGPFFFFFPCCIIKGKKNVQALISICPQRSHKNKKYFRTTLLGQNKRILQIRCYSVSSKILFYL